ncbi:MAG: 4-(cytidine 5'-diphospho)-2-C-methyl-D-erythritol kinase [Actinobacteria bacterium]|nr:4-(cytidine 5'-diphospho)-2-C-methyl-D-erythritol kinase [Actinomycetota bacterium]
MNGPCRLRALAKLTLSLRVVGVRADGYHLLDAEMVNVDLADTLEFWPGEGLEVVDGGASLRGHGHVPTDGTNLVARALELVGARARVRLVKRVPAGAGLGGGSADAAAVLRWASTRHPVEGGFGDRCSAPLSAAKALELASKLGSDVPFCLAGGGRARVGGTGEELSVLPFGELAGSAYTLLIPPFGVSTAAVYAAWDQLQSVRTSSQGPNDLEPAALRVEPRLAQWRDRLGNATGEQPILAGSGSTWWVRGEWPGDGRVVVRAARPQ